MQMVFVEPLANFIFIPNENGISSGLREVFESQLECLVFLYRLLYPPANSPEVLLNESKRLQPKPSRYLAVAFFRGFAFNEDAELVASNDEIVLLTIQYSEGCRCKRCGRL